ncbi:uncharacterized protein LOC114534847 [Dendronephthya gigantea]|uniref:uncharacterized protein LOC114534847 n=1 Tax=Dendronephthya gigantea TaxID=151771 RepID=UPI001069F03C|nr:uncharacterized protein LOC114534847 [Dendronephthya gigantea]
MASTYSIAQSFLLAVCIYVLYKIVKYFTSETNEIQARSRSNKRRLGVSEECMDILSTEKPGASNICLAISIKSEECLVRQHVCDALILLAKRQPMLRAVITTVTSGDKYFEIKDINEVITMLDITTSDVKASDWQDVWFEYTARQSGNGLLWRVVILKEEFIFDTREYMNTLMFNFEHSCTDGVSSIKFCKQFLHNMNELANGTSGVDQEISRSKSLELLPEVHEIVTRGRIWHALYNLLLTYCCLRPILRFCMKKILPQIMEKKPNNPYHEQFPPDQKSINTRAPCRLNVKVFSEKETSDIIQTCRANNCTVTAAVITAAHLAFCKLLDSEKSKDSKIDYLFAIDGQRFCDPKPNKDYLGHFVYIQQNCHMKYTAGDCSDFWKLAKDTTEEIKTCVKGRGCVAELTVISGLMKTIELMKLFFNDKLFPKSSCNFISSFGSFNLENDGNYKLNACFINNLVHGSNCTFSHFIHTINGKMTWQIASNLTVYSEHADAFANRCYDKLIEVSRS